MSKERNKELDFYLIKASFSTYVSNGRDKILKKEQLYTANNK